MACVTVTAATAIGVSIAKSVVKHKEKKSGVHTDEIKTSKKLGYLEMSLWGGSIILAAEHMIHGEIVPFPPFLTAMSSPESTAEMLKEMGTVGVGMTLAIVGAWAIGMIAYKLKLKKKNKNPEAI